MTKPKYQDPRWDNDAQVAGAIVVVLACIVALVWQIAGRVK